MNVSAEATNWFREIAADVEPWLVDRGGNSKTSELQEAGYLQVTSVWIIEFGEDAGWWRKLEITPAGHAILAPSGADNTGGLDG